MQRISQHLNPFTCCGSCCCARPFFPCAADHRRPCADHALYVCAVTSLPGGKGCSGVFWAKRGRFWTNSPRSQKRTFFGGPAPHVHFPGGRLCREALKSGHRGASDPVVRDTAEGLGPQGLPSGIGAHSGQHPRHHLHHPHPWRALMRMMPVMRGMLGMLSPKSGQFCRKRA